MMAFFIGLIAFVIGYIVGWGVCERTLVTPNYYEGHVSNINLYDRALDSHEIKNIYNQANPGGDIRRA